MRSHRFKVFFKGSNMETKLSLLLIMKCITKRTWELTENLLEKSKN